TPEYAAINPLQRMPALILDDGTIITESIAICRYFEMLHPEPPMFGVGPKDSALVEMWNRRAEINFFANVAAVFRHTHPAMKELEVPQVPAWADANRPRVAWFLEMVDGELANREFIAGDRYTVADITMQVAVDFMKPARLVMPEGVANVKRWHAGVWARPSACACSPPYEWWIDCVRMPFISARAARSDWTYPSACLPLPEFPSRTGRPRLSPAGGRHSCVLRPDKSLGPCASNRLRSRNRTCLRPSS